MYLLPTFLSFEETIVTYKQILFARIPYFLKALSSLVIYSILALILEMHLSALFSSSVTFLLLFPSSVSLNGIYSSECITLNMHDIAIENFKDALKCNSGSESPPANLRKKPCVVKCILCCWWKWFKPKSRSRIAFCELSDEFRDIYIRARGRQKDKTGKSSCIELFYLEFL